MPTPESSPPLSPDEITRIENWYAGITERPRTLEEEEALALVRTIRAREAEQAELQPLVEAAKFTLDLLERYDGAWQDSVDPLEHDYNAGLLADALLEKLQTEALPKLRAIHNNTPTNKRNPHE